MKKIKLLLLFTIILLFTGCTKQEDEIIMVTEAGFAPYEYYENGEIVGVDISIANEIASSLGKKLVVKDIAFDSIINELKTGKADFALAGMSITEERLKEVDFSVPYTTSRQVVIVKNDSNINNINYIYNKKIAVQLGSVADLYLTENYPNAELIRQKKYLSMVEDLKADKIDLIVMDELPAKQILNSNDELKMLEGYITEDSYGIAVKKGNTELLNEINKVITELINENKIEEYVVKNTLPETSNILYNTLIYQDRYKFILEGLGNTIIMALCATIIGTVLGIFIAIIRDNYEKNKKLPVLNTLCKIYVSVIRGTPALLQLMIIYYVIFKSVEINGILVGVIAFGLNSAAYVSEIIKSGINSIGKGQMEASRALGFNYSKSMSYVIMPQAIKNILPALGNEFITLLKETSVAGYIGIMDLTKASDIIASRTYEYFVPLIIVAIIYLIMTLGLSSLVKLMERKL